MPSATLWGRRHNTLQHVAVNTDKVMVAGAFAALVLIRLGPVHAISNGKNRVTYPLTVGHSVYIPGLRKPIFPF